MHLTVIEIIFNKTEKNTLTIFLLLSVFKKMFTLHIKRFCAKIYLNYEYAFIT